MERLMWEHRANKNACRIQASMDCTDPQCTHTCHPKNQRSHGSKNIGRHTTGAGATKAAYTEREAFPAADTLPSCTVQERGFTLNTKQPPRELEQAFLPSRSYLRFRTPRQPHP